MGRGIYMTLKQATLFVGLASVFAASVISITNAQVRPAPTRVVQLTGLAGVKDNAKGTLSVENGNLHFVRGKTVRFFGGNLKATYDFTKKAARAAHESLSLPDHE